MALTAVAPTTKGRSNDVVGARRVTYLRLNMGASYVTGGLPFTPKLFGHQGAVDRVVIQARFAAGATGTLTRRFEYDYTNKTIVAIVTSTGAEVANAADLTLCTLDVEVYSD